MNLLRWDPTLREWVAYATRRQDRTFLPPAEYCPLCPTEPGGFPTEVEREHYEIAVFENKFPSFAPDAGPREEVAYVFIFENKGEAIGVTLHHPHGQIYGFPFIPPRPAEELRAASEYR